ncbi:OmpL47-type beta-barrel domain-containing protein [Paenibacillus qinlingensis]|uniref:OmpL47-type beta-barrel domain-containing protein n=1 Tax=Paenibacillus qinlingensis TaxID=1837343 RepID=UPI00156490DD|nr:Ig-like domain-containing protein [Paenibacillus qinlingensis]NQX64230.1 Ig-like domain-containing protein [Paenibacillus qinlingensis]
MFNYYSLLASKTRGRRFLTLLLCLTLIMGLMNLIPQRAFAATDYYVATSGSDSNPGTQALPFLTILKASQVATPGTTVHVAPGTYVGSFRTNTSGTATARIRYVSDTKWGARLVPPVVNANGMIWDNQGSYVDIDGFEVDGNGSDTRNGLYNEGSYVAIKNNHVHDIATNIACTGSGGAAINTDYYHYGIMTEVSGNVVHDIGYAGCSFIQAIYISTSGTVKNNLVYNTGGAGIHLWHDANNVTIANNTVFSSWFGIVVGGGDYWHTTGPADYINVSNNIIYDNGYGISEQGDTGINNTYTNNLVYQNSTYNWSLHNGLTHTGTITADPQFVYYNASGGGDYHLSYASPAIDMGLSTYAPLTDLDGISRPSGVSYDIGAYEYSPTTFTLNAVSRSLRIGDSTQLISSSNLSGAQYVSDNPSVATVDQNGVVTALANGAANITATLSSGTSLSSTISFIVAERLQSVTLQTNELRPEIGQTQQYTVSGMMSDGSAAALSNAIIRYYMNGNTVASVSSSGMLTGKSSGTDMLNVDVTLDGVTKRTSTVVTVDPSTLAFVSLSVPKDTLVKGQTGQLTVSGISNNGKVSAMKNATIAYRSSNPSIASVNTSGLVTAFVSGTADITVDVTFNGHIYSATRGFTILPGISIVYPFTSLPIVSKTAGTIIYAPTLQFEAVTEGPSITFSLNVSETHLYQLSLKTFKATSYGNYAIKIDGQPFAQYQFYGSTGRGTAFEPIGAIQLTSGVHQLTFENIGKNPESSNYKMGVIDLELLAYQDTTAPTTTSNVYGEVKNGWYHSDVQVNLSAADVDTGVSKIEYRLDQSSVWQTYAGPIQVATEGLHTLYYRSTDGAGNVEVPHSLPIHIDKTAPLLSVQLNKTTLWPANHKMVSISATLSSSDAGSGVASIILSSISSNEPNNGDDIEANIGTTDTSFKLRAERLGSGSGRIYTVTYTITDQAGNQKNTSATVTVPHDHSGH